MDPPTTSTRTKDAEEAATLALMACATTHTQTKETEEGAALALMACTADLRQKTCADIAEDEGATLALLGLTSAANREEQCKLHEGQVLLALHTENKTALPVRNFWKARGTGKGALKTVRLVLRGPGVPAFTHASPVPVAASAGPMKRRAESTSGASSPPGKKVCQWKGTVLFDEQYLRPHAQAAPLLPAAVPAAAPAPAVAAPSKAVRCKWRTTQQILPVVPQPVPVTQQIMPACSSRWVHVAI